MLDETFKGRIFDNITANLPLSFTSKDENNVDHTVTYTPSVFRYKDKQPSSLPIPSITLRYKGGYPAMDIGTVEMGKTSTEIEVDYNKRSALNYSTLTGEDYIEFTLEMTEIVFSKLSLWLEFPSGQSDSTSGIIVELYDRDGILIGSHTTYYYEIQDFTWNDVYTDAFALVKDKFLTIRVSHYQEVKVYGVLDKNYGIRVYKDGQNEYLFRAYTDDEVDRIGYFYREELELIIHAVNDETQTVPVNGYLIANEIFNLLQILTIDWHYFPEADLESIGKPTKLEDESNPPQTIYILKFPVFFKYIGGVVDTDPAPLIKEFNITRTVLL